MNHLTSQPRIALLFSTLMAVTASLASVAAAQPTTQWEQVPLTIPGGAMVRDIHFISDRDIYVTLRKGGVRHSADRGATWDDITGELAGLDAIAIARSADYTVVVSAGGKAGGVFRLVKGRWIKGVDSPSGLAWLQRHGKSLLAYGGPVGTGGHIVYRSTDNGVSWKQIASVNRGIGQVFQQAPNGDLWIGCEACGPFRSTDGGETWKEIASGRKAMNGATFVFPSDGSVIYAAHSQLLRWTAETNEFKLLAPNGAFAAPGLPYRHQAFSSTTTGDGALWLSTGMAYNPTINGFIYKSSDHGATWIRQSNNLPVPADRPDIGAPRLSVIRADPNGVLYVGVGKTALWRTTSPVARPDASSPPHPSSGPEDPDGHDRPAAETGRNKGPEAMAVDQAPCRRGICPPCPREPQRGHGVQPSSDSPFPGGLGAVAVLAHAVLPFHLTPAGRHK